MIYPKAILTLIAIYYTFYSYDDQLGFILERTEEIYILGQWFAVTPIYYASIVLDDNKKVRILGFLFFFFNFLSFILYYKKFYDSFAYPGLIAFIILFVILYYQILGIIKSRKSPSPTKTPK